MAQLNLTAGDEAHKIPEEFAIWILEWAERAVIGWASPGLDGGLGMDVCGRGRKRV
jgi:hypothetical protein